MEKDENLKNMEKLKKDRNSKNDIFAILSPYLQFYCKLLCQVLSHKSYGGYICIVTNFRCEDERSSFDMSQLSQMMHN